MKMILWNKLKNGKIKFNCILRQKKKIKTE